MGKYIIGIVKKLNTAQRKFLSDFLNGLAIAWFSAGVISPIFVNTDKLIRLVIQVAGSLAISAILVLVGIKNLKRK